MAQQTINVGASPNDGTGTPLRTAFQYTNSNFSELYTAVGPSGNNIVVPGTATITGDLTVDTSTLKVDSTNDVVLIGSATKSLYGGNKLEVRGASISDANLGVTNTGNLAILTTDSQAIDTGGVLSLGGGFNGTTPYIFAGISGRKETSTNGIAQGYLQFFTTNVSNGIVERYRIAGDGVHTWRNVGGTSGTAMTLNASGLGMGVVPYVSWPATSKALQLGASSAIEGRTNDGSRTTVYSNTVWNGTNLIYQNQAAAAYYQQAVGVHSWHTNSNTPSAGNTATFTQAMTLDASGNLLVGTTSGLYRGQFAVAAGADRNIFTAQVTSASNGLQVQWNHATTTLRVVLSNIPTSAAGLAAGTLWNDAGTIKIA